jgi:hypothetical protein
MEYVIEDEWEFSIFSLMVVPIILLLSSYCIANESKAFKKTTFYNTKYAHEKLC